MPNFYGNVRDSSRDAYAHLKAEGKLGPKQKQIVAFIEKRPGSDFSRIELSSGTGLPINCVAGRVKELIDLGVLKEGRRRACTITHNNIRPVMLVQGRLLGGRHG